MLSIFDLAVPMVPLSAVSNTTELYGDYDLFDLAVSMISLSLDLVISKTPLSLIWWSQQNRSVMTQRCLRRYDATNISANSLPFLKML
jgi:hypothetical protein